MAVEHWKNATKSTAYVLKFDRFQNVISEVVNGGRTVTLTKEEREMNQERAANNSLDIFANGMLTPVRLVDPEDEKSFASNPNLLGEEELREMLKLSRAAFQKKIDAISTVYPLLRLQQLAEEEDAKVTTGVAQALAEKIASLRPEPPKMVSFADDV